MSTALSIKLADDFGGTTRKRGQQYYYQGLVRIQGGSDSQVTAHVLGSRTYEVSLRLEEDELQAWCDCPQFENEPCKHLWATILAAESKHYLADAAAIGDLYLDVDSLVVEPGDESAGDFLEDEAPFRLSNPAVPKPAPPKPPAWRKQVTDVAGSRPEFAVEVWAPKR